MAVRWVEKTVGLVGTFIDRTITYPAPREASGLTQALSNSDPGTASATFAVTLASTDFPTCPLFGNEWCIIVHLKGQNTSGATATLQHAAGHVISSTDTVLHTVDGNTVATGDYFNDMLHVWQGAYTVGDKIYVRLWSDKASGVTLQFTHLQVLPTRILLAPPGYVLGQVTLDYELKPTFTAGTTTWNTAGMAFGGIDLATVWVNNSTGGSGSRSFSYLPNQNAAHGAIKSYYGDLSKDLSSAIWSTSTPTTTQNGYPTRVRGRLLPSYQ